jgi:uncharacterized protein (TIRG00374 family)
LVVLKVIQIDSETSVSFGGYQLNRGTLAGIASGMAKLSLIMVAGMISISIDTTREWIKRLIIKSPAVLFFLRKPMQAWVRKNISGRIVELVDNIASGFALVKSPAKLVGSLVLSVAIWVTAVLSYMVFAMGCPGVSLSFFEMTAVLVIICLFIALPSVPGYWGLWEAGGIFALTMFGVSNKEAAGFTLANHAIQTLPIIVIGACSALITGVNIWRASTEQSRQ